MMPFRRGAWLRVYGIPIHAWNESFFKLCILECGSYLRSDNCSMTRQRLDYARVLVSTTLFEVINVSEQISIEGVLVEIKIIEEWGFSLGEDACLSDDDGKSVVSCPDNAELHEDMDINNNVDILVEKIVKDVRDAEDEDHNFFEADKGEENLETTAPVETHTPSVSRSGNPDSPKHMPLLDTSGSFNEQPSLNVDSISLSSKNISAHMIPDACSLALNVGVSAKAKVDDLLPRKRGVQPISASQVTAQSSRSGMWSVEWLYNIQ